MAGVSRIGQYVLRERLGQGSFGTVIRAEHAITGHEVAVKVVNRQKVMTLDMVPKIKREIQILKLFRHPHIIKLYQVISSPTDIFMVMEYVSGGELFDYLLSHDRLTEAAARRFFQQIISGVDYCHRHMVVHRDLKPENLLLDKNQNVKIADFGLSNMMTDGNFLKTSCGSPNYAAPEVICGQLYAGPEVDVWSCGVVLYVLLCAKLPFDDRNVQQLFKKIKGGVFTIPQHLSSNAVDLVSSMLRVDPLLRATIANVTEHPWFRQDLPDYIDQLLTNEDEEVDELDEEAVSTIAQKFHVSGQVVLDALSGDNETDQFVIAYRLIVDNKRIAATGHRQQTAEEAEVSGNLFQEEKPSQFARDSFDSPKPTRRGSPSVRSPSVRSPLRRGSSADSPRQSRKKKLIIPAGQKRYVAQRVVKRSRFHLGMRSKNKPEDIMREVYRAMASLNFQWKVIGPYHARCRTWNQISGTMMKMSLQLYSTSQGYLLDFKNLPTCSSDRLRPLDADADAQGTCADDSSPETHTLEFFELCAMLIQELGR